jgi:predicted nucleic acid-binding protein
MPQDEAVFLDSNVWLYAFVKDKVGEKNRLAQVLVQRPKTVLSTQVINEVCVNLKKKLGYSENQLKQLIQAFYTKYTVVTLDCTILLTSADLREHYKFSFWDSLVVASALEAKVVWLYSEDMQHGLKVEGQLTIINPFIDCE